MSDPLDVAVPKAIAALIKGVAPKANVMDHWRMPFDINVWPGFLRSVDDNNLVHAWAIGENNVMQLPKSPQVSNAHKNYDVTYRVWGFLQWREGTDTDNSAIDLRKEFAAVADVFSTKAQLGITDQTIAAFVKGHNELQVQNPIDVFNLGGTEVHIIRGSLQVLMYKQVS